MVKTAMVLFVLSFPVLIVATILMPESYSWIENTVSESGGQGVGHAWVFRSAVLATSAGALLLTTTAGDLWGRWGKSAFRLYGCALVGAAIFSEAPWDGAPHDGTEAYMHTVFAFLTGAGFAFGVLSVAMRRPSHQRLMRFYDGLILIGMVTVPLVMLAIPQNGLLQRSLIFAGYVWLLMEAARIQRLEPVSSPGERIERWRSAGTAGEGGLSPSGRFRRPAPDAPRPDWHHPGSR